MGGMRNVTADAAPRSPLFVHAQLARKRDNHAISNFAILKNLLYACTLYRRPTGDADARRGEEIRNYFFICA